MVFDACQCLSTLTMKALLITLHKLKFGGPRKISPVPPHPSVGLLMPSYWHIVKHNYSVDTHNSRPLDSIITILTTVWYLGFHHWKQNEIKKESSHTHTHKHTQTYDRKYQSLWGQAWGTIHACLLVSSPDPTLSQEETVWWTKSNFLG